MWVAAILQWGWWFALAEVEVAGWFGLQLRKKFLFLPLLKPATVMPAGVTDLLAGAAMEFVFYHL
jgi:hypothetical protein